MPILKISFLLSFLLVVVVRAEAGNEEPAFGDCEKSSDDYCEGPAFDYQPVSISSNANMNIGDIFPNFVAETTIGEIDFYDWLGTSWGILFSHPADFTPVCTTELSRVAQLYPEFIKRNVKPIALSIDSVESHLKWIPDIKSYGNIEESKTFPYPIIDDSDRTLAVKFGMLDRDEINAQGVTLTCRAVFIIDPKRKMRVKILYPASSGRNFDEILRIIDSVQLTDSHKVATPVDWKRGDACMVLPTIKNEELQELFPKGVETLAVPSGKTYIRQTPNPAD